MAVGLVAFLSEAENGSISIARLDFDLFGLNNSSVGLAVQVVRISSVTNRLEGTTVELLESAVHIDNQISRSIGSWSVLSEMTVSKDGTKDIGTIELKVASKRVLALYDTVHDFL